MHLVERIDDYGRAAWIALMVLGFVIFWPIGLAILGFLLWSGRMSCGHAGNWGAWKRRKWERLQDKMERMRDDGRGRYGSGNSAFDAYREETLRRLEEEQREFNDFLRNLRHAKDKAEFDQFMAQRRSRPQTPPEGESPAPGSYS